jgi:hypothetical protein
MPDQLKTSRQPSLLESLTSGIAEMVSDIRRKVVEEGWFGRATTPEPLPRQSDAGHVTRNTTHHHIDHQQNISAPVQTGGRSSAEVHIHPSISDRTQNDAAPRSPYAAQGMPAQFEEYHKGREGKEISVEREKTQVLER